MSIIYTEAFKIHLQTNITVSEKKIPDIINYNLKKDNQILIIFGTDVLDTTGHQMTMQVPTPPNVYFCTDNPSSDYNW